MDPCDGMYRDGDIVLLVGVLRGVPVGKFQVVDPFARADLGVFPREFFRAVEAQPL